jgi:thimet oligopeptidase
LNSITMHIRSIACLLLPGLLGACSSAPEENPIQEPVAIQPSAESDGPIAKELALADRALDTIAALSPGEVTFKNSIAAYDAVIANFFNATRMRAFMENVSMDADERELGSRISADMGDWFSKLNKRRDLYRVFQTFADTQPKLDEQDARMLALTLRDFLREGMGLEDGPRIRLAAIDNELNKLGIEFRGNITADRTVSLLSKSELAGCDESFLESLPRADDLYIVASTGPNLTHIVSYCTQPQTRKKIVVARGQRAAGKNTAVLTKLISLRNEKAQIMGFESTADYETAVRMAGDSQTVRKFYADLQPKLRKKSEQDFEEYQNAKREDTGDPKAKLYAWDVSYYKDWLLREKYAIDTREVVSYFPIESVTTGLFAVAQKLYNVEFKDISESARSAGRPMWHADVRLYEVWDKTDAELLGEFYTDLHPRASKYTHAAQFPIKLRRETKAGVVSRPLVALVCNFTKPTQGKPSLMTHGEVRTFFHEFGHCLHSIFTKSRHANISGTNVARDFVEAPSQMFENWAWSSDVLGTFAKHYETGAALPKELLDRMVAAKNLGSGLGAEGQVYLGTMDFGFHSDPSGDVDLESIRKQAYSGARMFEALDNVPSYASFGHLVGYQAGYYGYLWSLVYASDMFSRFSEVGLMDAGLGREYRDKILSRGGTRDELEMLKDFLGREPNSSAFLQDLGLQ